MSSYPAGPGDGYPPRPPQPPLSYQVPPPRRPAWRRARVIVTVLVVLIGLLVAADFGARALAEDRFATEIQSQGFPRKPEVSIAGFPFLTQLISRYFGQVDLSSVDVPDGPVTIKTITAVLNGVRVNSGFNGATVSRLTGTAFITFPELSGALISRAGGALGDALRGVGLRLSDAGPDLVRASINLVLVSGSATWRISRLSGTGIRARLVTSSGLFSGLGGAIGNVTIPLPSLPLGVRLTSLAVTPAGVVGRLSGRNLSFGG
jgi:LmeA-like phospholipid-binding